MRLLYSPIFIPYIKPFLLFGCFYYHHLSTSIYLMITDRSVISYEIVITNLLMFSHLDFCIPAFFKQLLFVQVESCPRLFFRQLDP